MKSIERIVADNAEATMADGTYRDADGRVWLKPESLPMSAVREVQRHPRSQAELNLCETIEAARELGRREGEATALDRHPHWIEVARIAGVVYEAEGYSLHAGPPDEVVAGVERVIERASREGAAEMLQRCIETMCPYCANGIPTVPFGDNGYRWHTLVEYPCDASPLHKLKTEIFPEADDVADR